MTVSRTNCCGMFELYDLYKIKNTESDEEVSFRLVKELYYTARKNSGWQNHKPFVVFTDPDHYTNGSRLYHFIKENKLGTVLRSAKRYNPNSGNNDLRVYTWAVDYKALKNLVSPPRKKSPARKVR